MTNHERKRFEQLADLKLNALTRLPPCSAERERWAWLTAMATLYLGLAGILPSFGFAIVAGAGFAWSVRWLVPAVIEERLWKQALKDLEHALIEEGTRLGGAVRCSRYPCRSESWRIETPEGTWEFGYIMPGKHPPRRAEKTTNIRVLKGPGLVINRECYRPGSGRIVEKRRLLLLEALGPTAYSAELGE